MASSTETSRCAGGRSALSVEFRIVRLVLLEHVVNGREQHPGNGDNGFLVSPAFLECKIAIADFWKLLGTNRTESALNKQVA